MTSRRVIQWPNLAAALFSLSQDFQRNAMSLKQNGKTKLERCAALLLSMVSLVAFFFAAKGQVSVPVTVMTVIAWAFKGFLNLPELLLIGLLTLLWVVLLVFYAKPRWQRRLSATYRLPETTLLSLPQIWHNARIAFGPMLPRIIRVLRE